MSKNLATRTPFHLGRDMHNELVHISQDARLEGTYILGANGVGKSNLIATMILDDIDKGLGTCLLDPHGDLTDDVLSRMRTRVDDVILVDLSSKDYVAGFNIFHCKHPEDPFASENVISAVMHIMEKVYGVSKNTPQMFQYYDAIANTLIYNPDCTILDIKRMLTDEAFRLHILQNVPDEDVLWFWKQYFKYRSHPRRDDEIAAVVNKLTEFTKRIMRPWFGHTKNTINMRDVMDNNKLLFIKLNSRWDSSTSLLGSIIIAQLLDAAYSRQDTTLTKRQPFHVYADEFQKFASQDFATLFTEARKYRLGLTVGHQVFEQLDETIKATCRQAASVIVFRVSPDNAEEIANTFDCKPIPGGGEPRFEQLRTPVKESIQHMLERGVHPSPVVREFVDKWGRFFVEGVKLDEEALRKYERFYETDPRYTMHRDFPIYPEYSYTNCLLTLNDLFYQAMLFGKEGKDTDTLAMNSDGAANLFIKATHSSGIIHMYKLRDYGSTYTYTVSDYPARLRELQNTLVDMPAARYRTLAPLYYARTIARKIKSLVTTQYEQAQGTIAEERLRDKWYTACNDLYEREVAVSGALHDIPILQQREKEQIEKEIALIQQIIATRKEYRIALAEFKQQICLMLRELAIAPVEADSGLMREIPTELSSVEVRARIANSLKLQPKYTARMRTQGGEYSLTTLPPTQGIPSTELAERIKWIQEENCRQGYLLLRSEVEKQIAARKQIAPPVIEKAQSKGLRPTPPDTTTEGTSPPKKRPRIV